MNKYLKWILPVLTILSLLYIFSNSLLSNPDAEKKEDRFLSSVEKVVEVVTDKEIDLDRDSAVPAKIAHVAEYVLFSFLLTYTAYFLHSMEHTDRYRLLFTFLFCALTDENLQSLKEGRSSRVTDIIIDFAGCLIGYALVNLIWKLMERRKNGKRISGT